MSKEIKVNILGKEISLHEANNIYQQLDKLFRDIPKLYKLKQEDQIIHHLDNSSEPSNEILLKKRSTRIIDNDVDMSKMSYN